MPNAEVKLIVGFDDKSMAAVDRMTESLDMFSAILKDNPNDIERIVKLLRVNLRVLCFILKAGIVSKREKISSRNNMIIF